jgi:hypothetical protein
VRLVCEFVRAGGGGVAWQAVKICRQLKDSVFKDKNIQK